MDSLYERALRGTIVISLMLGFTRMLGRQVRVISTDNAATGTPSLGFGQGVALH